MTSGFGGGSRERERPKIVENQYNGIRKQPSHTASCPERVISAHNAWSHAYAQPLQPLPPSHVPQYFESGWCFGVLVVLLTSKIWWHFLHSCRVQLLLPFRPDMPELLPLGLPLDAWSPVEPVRTVMRPHTFYGAHTP